MGYILITSALENVATVLFKALTFFYNFNFQSSFSTLRLQHNALRSSQQERSDNSRIQVTIDSLLVFLKSFNPSSNHCSFNMHKIYHFLFNISLQYLLSRSISTCIYIACACGTRIVSSLPSRHSLPPRIFQKLRSHFSQTPTTPTTANPSLPALCEVLHDPSLPYSLSIRQSQFHKPISLGTACSSPLSASSTTS
jgi:hypothetical protein